MRLTSGGGGAGAALRTRAGSAAALPTGSGPRAGSAPDEEMGGAGLSVDASGAGAGASSSRLTVDSRRGSVGSLKASIACPMNRMARTVITATTPVTSHIVRDPTCRGLSRSSPNRASRCLGLGILGRVMWGFAIWRSDMRGRLSLSRRRSATSAPAPNPPRPASSSDSSRASSANSLCTAGFGTRRLGTREERGSTGVSMGMAGPGACAGADPLADSGTRPASSSDSSRGSSANSLCIAGLGTRWLGAREGRGSSSRFSSEVGTGVSMRMTGPGDSAGAETLADSGTMTKPSTISARSRCG